MVDRHYVHLFVVQSSDDYHYSVDGNNGRFVCSFVYLVIFAFVCKEVLDVDIGWRLYCMFSITIHYIACA